MKVEDLAVMVPHCPVKDCGARIEKFLKWESPTRGDVIKLTPCKHIFIETGQGIKLL